MKTLTTITFTFLTLSWMAPAAQAAGDHGTGSHATHQMTAMAEATLSEGEIRKVDKAAGKLTIKHGPLENLGMPAMTMIFRVKESAMLDQVKPGDRVKFLVEKVDGAFTVTRLQVVTP